MCDCKDCLNNETPCNCDCDIAEACGGCKEAAAEAMEAEFEAACAQGCV